MKRSRIFYIAILVLVIASCASKKPKPEVVQVPVFPETPTNLQIELEKHIYTRAIDLSFHAASKSNFKMAIIYLKEAMKMRPTEKKLSDNLEDLKKSLSKSLTSKWQESVVEEQYNRIYCKPKSENCAIEKWRSIIRNDIEESEYYKKSLEKLIQYELVNEKDGRYNSNF